MTIKVNYLIRAAMGLVGLSLFLGSSSEAFAGKRGGPGFAKSLQNSVGYFFNTGGKLALEIEHDDLMSAIEVLFRESRFDPRGLSRGSEVVIYCVSGRSEELSSVLVLEQTRRGLTLKELIRAGNVIFKEGRRQVHAAQAVAELNYAYKIEMPHTRERIEVKPGQKRSGWFRGGSSQYA